MELLTKLGIDGRLLIAQVVNFLILLAVLYKFLYRPVLGMLHSREEKIAKGIQQADTMELRMKEIEALKESTILEARRIAQQMGNQARADAEVVRAELLEKAKQDAKKVMDEGIGQIQAFKEIALREARSQLAVLVTSATGQVIGEVMDSEVDARLVEKVVERMGRA